MWVRELSALLDRVPYFGDDACRMLWPGAKSSGVSEETLRGLENVHRWIRKNTGPDAKFVGPRDIRVGALRAVIHEMSGAGMLIEGNPRAFVDAAKREWQLREVSRETPSAVAPLLRRWGADYWVTTQAVADLPAAYEDGPWHVYDLRKAL